MDWMDWTCFSSMPWWKTVSVRAAKGSMPRRVYGGDSDGPSVSLMEVQISLALLIPLLSSYVCDPPLYPPHSSAHIRLYFKLGASRVLQFVGDYALSGALGRGLKIVTSRLCLMPSAMRLDTMMAVCVVQQVDN